MEHLLINHYEVAAVILFGIGFLNLLLQHNLVKKVIGFGIMDSAIYLFLASQGFIEGGIAPILVGAGPANAADYINPVPAGLVLTGIVVSVSVTAFSLALIQRLYQKYKTVDFDEIVQAARIKGDE